MRDKNDQKLKELFEKIQDEKTALRKLLKALKSTKQDQKSHISKGK
ncbi:hypothetical protein [Sediminitomix flava]|nr:hypothetical protein [Sediminitomix flava]